MNFRLRQPRVGRTKHVYRKRHAFRRTFHQRL
ncbi:MAG: hypothetical protein JWQ46_2090 [Phenylobacterium sp.]|jgi:hypothetical protein|nr:hypothetical protein [Phenylobacterium sp.]